jgi:hypothetical protein
VATIFVPNRMINSLGEPLLQACRWQMAELDHSSVLAANNSKILDRSEGLEVGNTTVHLGMWER